MQEELDLSPAVRETLARHHFDRALFEALRARLRGGADPEALHRIQGRVDPPPAGCAARAPAAGTAEHARLTAEGSDGIARGEVAVVILAGGMATRFGSVVKGLAPIFEGRPTRFLDAKLADVERAGPSVDVTLMTSFATDAAIREALARDGRREVRTSPQFVSLRLRADGALFRDASGAPSLYATGHGDLPDALRVSGALARLRARGVRTVLMSNVDNVGATLDPALYAMHRASGSRISVELVEKVAGDRGGLPVVHDGRLVLAEAFRLSKDFPIDAFPLFNTNTLWIDLEALEAPHDWTWCVARKKVDGLDAVQFERLVGELTWWNSTHWLHVPRDAAASRFIPVKDLDDLRAQRPLIDAVLRERCGLGLTKGA